ncbi:MAG: trypsin-like serine protease [Planctomicrobium sp.]|jgi:thioredoxin|nr:trypsin-like serine protease [Planctomicrobium sp.]
MTRSLALCIALVIASSSFAADPENIVYDFSAVWCGPCQQMVPLVEKLKREGLPIRKVDIDKEKSLAEKYNISSIPTFVVVVNGQEVQRQSGALTEPGLRQMLAKVPETSSGDLIASNSSQLGIQLGESGSMTADDNNFVVRGNDAETSNNANPAPFINENLSADPMDSSVRIRVTVAGKVNLGSGTVIYSQQGMSKILTCAHIFRDFDDDSKIEVDLVINNRSQPYIAKLDNFNVEADLGLISVSTTTVLPVAEIAKVNRTPKSGEVVVGIGCSGGDDPTREQLQVTAIDRYQGPHNIECTGLPVRGRSGGGLFNKESEVVGVCIAADKEQNRGLYSGLLAVHSLLNQNGLAHLIQSKEILAGAIATNETPQAPGVPSDLGSPDSNDWTNNSPSGFPNGEPNVSPPLKVDPIDLKTGGAEVVVIIRDPNNPQQQNRVVILHDASPKFVSFLNGELEGDSGIGASMISHTESIRANSRQLKVASNTAQPKIINASIPKQSQLQQTSLSQPVQPRRYVRTAR